MNTMLKEWGPLAGRILISLIFLMSGLGKVFQFDGQVGYAASQGVPMASAAIAVSAVIEIAAALMIILGYKARLGAAALFLWMIPVNLMMHAFWGIADQTWHQIHMIMFMKNLAMMGGMLFIISFGSGPKSLKAD
jgi:putative oxidoreductase